MKFRKGQKVYLFNGKDTICTGVVTLADGCGWLYRCRTYTNAYFDYYIDEKYICKRNDKETIKKWVNLADKWINNSLDNNAKDIKLLEQTMEILQKTRSNNYKIWQA